MYNQGLPVGTRLRYAHGQSGAGWGYMLPGLFNRRGLKAGWVVLNCALQCID